MVQGTRSILLVDPLARDRGHLLSDDLFLAECVSPLTDEFLVMTSRSSISNIKQHLKVETLETAPYGFLDFFPRLRLLKLVLKLPYSRFNHVVFQSFEEVSTLLFMFLHPGNRMHLIVSNNLRPDRLKRHPILGRYFLRAVIKRAASVIVHSQHEIKMIKDMVPEIDNDKLFIKPYHQAGFQRVRLPLKQKSPKIIFMGPELPSKRLSPVLDLIKSDFNRRYNYVLFKMDGINPQTKTFLENQKNVEIFSGYVPDEKYYRLFSEASFVILTHNENFEGLYSGVFFDAIASGTAVIAGNMPPHDEAFQRFGPMGFLVDYKDPEWCKSFLNADLDATYEEFQNNMDKYRKSCSMESIRDVFHSIFSRF